MIIVGDGAGKGVYALPGDLLCDGFSFSTRLHYLL